MKFGDPGRAGKGSVTEDAEAFRKRVSRVPGAKIVRTEGGQLAYRTALGSKVTEKQRSLARRFAADGVECST